MGENEQPSIRWSPLTVSEVVMTRGTLVNVGAFDDFWVDIGRRGDGEKYFKRRYII